MAISQDLEIFPAEGRLKSRSPALCVSVVVILLWYRKVSAATCAEHDELASDYTARELSCTVTCLVSFLKSLCSFYPSY